MTSPSHLRPRNSTPSPQAFHVDDEREALLSVAMRLARRARQARETNPDDRSHAPTALLNDLLS
jgi:hypothetical protein